MLLQHLRKPVLAATLALLVIPGAALATDDNASPHGGLSVTVIADFPEPQPTVVLREACVYLEMNIPDYNCAVPLAQYAGQADEPGASQKPEGVDYKFWEENYWVFADGRATFPEDAEPPRRANQPTDRGLI